MLSNYMDNNYHDNVKIRQVVSVIVYNEDAVLSRISGLFSARGYNIDSLVVAPTNDEKYSRICIVTTGKKAVIDQIIKQLNKLIPVLKVIEHKNAIEKDTVLIKIQIEQNISDIAVIAKAYNGYIQNITQEAIIISATDEPRRIDNFINIMQRFKPLEVVKSGVVAMER